MNIEIPTPCARVVCVFSSTYRQYCSVRVMYQSIIHHADSWIRPFSSVWDCYSSCVRKFELLRTQNSWLQYFTDMGPFGPCSPTHEQKGHGRMEYSSGWSPRSSRGPIYNISLAIREKFFIWDRQDENEAVLGKDILFAYSYPFKHGYACVVLHPLGTMGWTWMCTGVSHVNYFHLPTHVDENTHVRL